MNNISKAQMDWDSDEFQDILYNMMVALLGYQAASGHLSPEVYEEGRAALVAQHLEGTGWADHQIDKELDKRLTR